MRSDRDKRSDTEREIDDFLSQFDEADEEVSADYSSYLIDESAAGLTDEDDTPESAGAEAAPEVTEPVPNVTDEQTFLWKPVGGGSLEALRDIKKQDEEAGKAAKEEAAAEEPEEIEKAPDKKPAPRKRHRGFLRHSKNSKKREIIADTENSPSVMPADEAGDTGSDIFETVPAEPASLPDAAEDIADKADKKESDHIAEEYDSEHIMVSRGSRRRRSYKDTGAAPAQHLSKEAAAGADIAGKKLVELTEQEVAYKKARSRVKKAPAKAVRSGKKAAGSIKKAGRIKKADKKNIKEALFYKKNPDYDPDLGDTYVKDGKTIKNKPLKFSFLKLLRDIAAVCLVFVLAGVIAATVMIASAPKYDYKDIYAAVDTSSVIYDDTGKQVDNVFYTENRKIIAYKDMPEDLIDSFVAIEDKTFWKHHGFNWTRMIGAVLTSLTGNGRISGTSTITQQLARNVYLADIKSVRSIKRKVLEMYYAARIEHALSKEQIIEAYLNTIYLGHGCYGVNAAAKTYFNKSVKKLDLVECASLAALPQSPDTYALLKLASEAQDVRDSKVVATEPDTVVTNDLAKGRRQLTLDLMLDQGLITQAEHDEVYNLSLNDFIDPNLKSSTGNYSYFHEYLVDTIIADLQEQYEMDYDAAERMVYTKGLKIYSTMNKEAQDVIAKEFQDGSNFPYVSAPKDGDGNLLNTDGKIALYNYKNFFDDEGNFTLSGDEGDVKINSDGSATVMKGHKLHIYETEVGESTDYSLEFKNYYIYDDNDILYSIAGGYVNIPMDYKSADGEGNVTISADFFSDEAYKGAVKIDGNDLILTEKIYTLSPRSRQPQGAMTIVGVGTGEVKAMAGGRQFGGQKVLNRSLNPRQPGSSIKPLAVYGAALQKSCELANEGQKWKFTDFGIDKQGTKGWGDYVTVHSSIEDEKTKIEGKYWPNNFNNSFSGKNTFKTAIQKSINTCAVKLELQIGADYSINQLKKFGLTTVQDDTSDPVNDANPAALALGAMTQGVEPLEMALAYAAFPGGGKVNTPICYYKVLDREDNVLLEGKSEQSEALDPGVAWIMTDVLRSVVQYNRYMYVEGVSPGGKTGTTNDQYDIWFDGFTPTYAASLWIGTDENLEMSSMSAPAAALWGRIINQLEAAKDGEYAEKPANVIQKGSEYFTKGTETGLTSWSDKEAREKRKKAAYQKWLKQRENHRHKVVDVAGHYENQLVTPEQYQTIVVQEAYDEPVIGPDGQPTGEVIHHDAVTQQVKVADAVYKQVWVEEKWHWEYDKGWDKFHYNDD